MKRNYVALLRAIDHVAMAPFREAMESLGFTEVASFGMSGNLLFNSDQGKPADHERRITERFETNAMIRTSSELARILAAEPFDSAVLFLEKAPSPAARRDFLALEFEEPAPVLRGKNVFYVYPSPLRGRRTAFDFERALGVRGTMRTARVARRLLELMRG